MTLKGKAVNGVLPDLGTFLQEEVYPRLSAEEVYTHEVHAWHKSADRWRGSCPWHDSESGTAFVVSLGSLLWWCAACQRGGGPLQYRWWLKTRLGQPLRGADFIEEVKGLAQLAGVAFPEAELSADQLRVARYYESRRAILLDLQGLAQEELWTRGGEEARDYLHARGFEDAGIRDLQMGLYRDPEKVKNWLSARRHTLADLNHAGVLNPNLAGYILIPWPDAYGRPLTIYGRYQRKRPPEGLPKTTALPGEGTKRVPLYFDRARRAGHQHLTLVEGVLDAALLQTRGETQAVACVGAQLSDGQIQTLRRHRVQSLTICLDPDPGGANGVLSCLKRLEGTGITGYVAGTLPDGQDPDEFVVANGIEAWRKHLVGAVHGYRYQARRLVDQCRSEAGWTDQAADQVMREALAFAAALPPRQDDELVRHFWPEIMAVTGSTEGSIRSRIDALRRPADAGANGPAHTDEPSPNGDGRAGGGHSGAAGATPTPPPAWEEPIPLGAEICLPHFPVDSLPDWLGRYAVAEAGATQTPIALAATTSLGACAGGLAGKFRVMVRPGWQEPTNLFVVNSLPPDERKSQVLRDALQPIQDLERRLQEEAAPRVAASACEHRILEGKVKSLEGKAAKAKPADVERLKTEAKEAARQLAAHQVPELPQLSCDDETPESLARLLARQGGRMLQASAEGTAFEICKGRYSDTANFDVYLKGHAGDSLRTGRVTRDSDTVDRPALTVVLAVQPDVIAGLASEAQLRGRGFLARWLYSLPPSKVGRRLVRARPVPLEVERTYQDNLTRLWQLEASADAPHLLHFSEEADEALAEFERWLEPKLAPEEELSLLAGWANKLAGAVARLAGILHVADAVGRSVAWDFPIDAATVDKAINIGRDYFLPHAQAAFAQMGADQRLEDARRILRWIGDQAHSVNCVNRDRETSPLVFSGRDLHAKVFGGTRKVEQVEAAIDLSVKHLYLRPIYREDHHGRGRKPSQKYGVNPYSQFTEFTECRNGHPATSNEPGEAAED
jgi:DNA primase